MKAYKLKFVLEEERLTVGESSNDGFSALELIGLLEMKKQDIIRQTHSEVSPEIMYKRTLVMEEPNAEEDA